MNYINLFLCCLFILACGVSVYFFYNDYKKKEKEQSYLENKEFLKKVNSTKGEFYYFYTKWCPHCKTANETLEKIKSNPIFKRFSLCQFLI